MTLMTTRKMPSYMYGLYHNTNARSSRNQAPQTLVLNARMRLTTGLATSTSNGQETPAQKSMAKANPMNTMPVPRSGCFMTNTHGMPTTSAGFQNSSSDFGASFNDASTFAKAMTTPIFASSAGWPIRKPPMASQLFVLAAVPPPFPTTNGSPSTRHSNTTN